MDGLKCSEVMLSRTITATNYFRLEAEYYNSKSLPSQNSMRGKDVINAVQYGTSKVCDEDPNGYPVLRLNELDNGFIKKPNKYCHILSCDEFEKLKLNVGDVLIIRTNGNPDLVGQAAVVLEDVNYAFASYLYRITTNKNINPETLISYLNCKYGRNEIDKNSMEGNQTNFSPAKFQDILIPILGYKFQMAVKNIVNLAYQKKKSADKEYLHAEQSLIDMLGIDLLNKSNVSTRYLSKSFLLSGRLDAEYYQPKYEVYESALHTIDTVNSLCDIHDKNYAPKSDDLYRYIELADVGDYGDISNVELIRGSKLPSRARRKVKTGQVIVSSVEGSLQSCALVTDEFDGALCSTGFYVLTSESINPETLLVLFKSEVIQALLKQRCSGTILTAITKDELLSMPLPKIDESVQSEIAVKVKESFALRRRSKELLDVAKQAVEMAIEQGEDVALAWLNDKVSNAEV